MNDLHPIGWYASRIAPRLPREAFKPAPERLWGGLVYALMTVGAIAAIGLLDLPLGINLLLSLAVSMGFAGLGFLGHEILHGTVVKTAWLRDLLGGICFAQFNLGAKLWRKWHNMEHHAHTQDDDTDPDAWATMEELYTRPFMRWVYRLPWWVRSVFNFSSFFVFFSIHSFLQLLNYYKEFKPQDRPVVLLQYLLPLSVWTTLLVLVGPYKWLFAYLIPLLLANAMVISYISTNHQLNPLTDVNDPLANSLTVTVPRWVDVLHFNFSYHTEHHIFPGMNPKWGPQVKAVAKELWPDRYHEMPMIHALAALWKTPRIYHDQVNLVDPERGLAYGTLGHGMQGARIQVRPVSVEVPVALGENPAQGD